MGAIGRLPVLALAGADVVDIVHRTPPLRCRTAILARATTAAGHVVSSKFPSAAVVAAADPVTCSPNAVTLPTSIAVDVGARATGGYCAEIGGCGVLPGSAQTISA